MSCVLPRQREKRGDDNEVGSGAVCTAIGFFVGSWTAVGFFIGDWSELATKACFFVPRTIFLGDKRDKSAQNKDEMLLGTLNKAGHSRRMTNNRSFLTTPNKVMSIKTKYSPRKLTTHSHLIICVRLKTIDNKYLNSILKKNLVQRQTSNVEKSLQKRVQSSTHSQFTVCVHLRTTDNKYSNSIPKNNLIQGQTSNIERSLQKKV